MGGNLGLGASILLRASYRQVYNIMGRFDGTLYWGWGMNMGEGWEALCLELAELDTAMRLHTWTVFGQEEAEDLEKAGAEMESEACGSTTDQPEEK